MVEITDEPIDEQRVLSQAKSTLAGAVVLFLGTTREFTGEKKTVHLEYECYREMALKEMQALADSAHEKWELQNCVIVHRVGEVPLGETSVAIAASSAHRPESFAAGKWLIDTLKEKIPIWKKENWSDGTKEWVHPGLENDE